MWNTRRYANAKHLVTVVVVGFVMLFCMMNREEAPMGLKLIKYKDFSALYVKPKEWNLLVDIDCLSKLSENKECQGPVDIAGTKYRDWDNVNFAYFIVDREKKDHIKLYSLTRADTKTRLMPRIVTKKQFVKISNNSGLYLEVPSDITSFARQWINSEFLECKNYKYNRTDNSRLISLNKTDVFTDYRLFADAFNTTFMLFGGTLLGWYRECDIISHTHDLDFTTYSSMIRPDMLHGIQQSFQVTYVFGRDNDTLEFFWYHKEIRTDLFFKYSYNASHERTGSLNFSPQQRIFSYYPVVKQICTGDLHGKLVYVPCNVDDILTVEYGNWKEDVPMGNYIYTRDPKNMVLEDVPADEFPKLKREKWP